MPYVIKRSTTPTTRQATGSGQELLAQYIHVSTPTRVMPASTTDVIFRVFGGRVLVRLLMGEVTTILQGTDAVLKISSQAMGPGAAVAGAAIDTTIGTAVDVATTLDTSSFEVGATIVVEGDATAFIKSNAGAASVGNNDTTWIAPRGQIYLTTTATKTGSIKWDLWYQPLDEGAYVTGTNAAAVKVT